MSDNYDRLYRFFSDLGFTIYRKERLESFNSYVIEGCSPYFCIKGLSDRLIEAIELRSSNEPDNWYDINLVIASIGREDKLDEWLDLEIQMKFVEAHVDELAILFDEENYPATKMRFKELGMQRAKNAFPRWFNN